MTRLAGGADPLRIGLIDDHAVVGAGVRVLMAQLPDLDLVASAQSVAELLEITDDLALAVLDLRLADGSRPQDNVESLHRAGVPVLVFTAGDEPALARSAARAGALGVVRKSEEIGVLVDAIRSAAAGEQVVTTEWAAALDGDPDLADACLSPREREVLALYASGEKSQRVANRTGLAMPTVKEYVDRIRAKYSGVGRPAPTKIDLYQRAVEDGLLPAPTPR